MSIEIKDLDKSFGSKQVLKNLNLSFKEGSFVSILGSSGCGKSTLLRLIAGLETPSRGTVSLTQSPISYVFQGANLLPWRTALENVLLPLELKNNSSRLNLEEDSLEALEKVQLQQAAKLFPHELSGGMQMRVSLARALVTKPKVLLLDEPFAALDELTRFEMQRQLLELWQRERMSIIFVTHSFSEAAFLSERIVMLKAPGHISMDLDLQYSSPRDEAFRTSLELAETVRKLSMELRR